MLNFYKQPTSKTQSKNCLITYSAAKKIKSKEVPGFILGFLVLKNDY